MNVYRTLQKTGSEPENKKTPPLPISSVGTDYTTTNQTNLPHGSALLTDTLDGSGNGSSPLKNKGITHIIHAAPKDRNSFSSHQEYINNIVNSVQNCIYLADRADIYSLTKSAELAIPLVGGEIFAGTCPKDQLAAGVVQGALNQLAQCSNLKKITFIEYNNSLFTEVFKNHSSSQAEVKKGDIRNKSLHGASVIVNAANTYVGFGGGISLAISQQVGNSGKIDSKARELIGEFYSLSKESDSGGGTKYTCPQCNNEYNTKDKPLVEGKYCSQACRKAAEPNETETCAFCSKTINVGGGESVFFYRDKSSEVKKFCSQEHVDEYKKKEKPSGPTDDLSQIRTQALSAIQTVLNSEPKLTASDLSPDCQDYENKLKQLNSENEINELKEKVLQDIQVKRKAKQEAVALDEKINSAQTEAEKVNLFKEAGKKIGEQTTEQTNKLEQIKNELAANPTQLRAAIQHEITAQMTAFEVKPEDLNSDIRTQLESLKTEQNATKIREIEKVVSQAVGKTGVNLKINLLEAEITVALQSKNQTKIKAIKTQLLQLISSPNTFYQAQKSQFQALLTKLEHKESQNQVPNKDGFP